MRGLNFNIAAAKSMAMLLLTAVFTVLAGCSQTTTSAPATTTTGVATASSVQLLVSSQQLLSSANASVTLTAVVLDANGQAMSGKVVSFSKGNDSSAYFSNLTALTGSNGVATATLNIGNNMANRAISVSATADTAVGTNTVNVTGTKIAISGNTSLALNAATTLSIVVKDSTGVAVQGIPLTVTSRNGNPITLTPSTGVSDSTGQITAVVTASVPGTGSDTLTVTGAGVTQTQTLTINSASFAFTAPTIVAPATTPEIVVNTLTPVTVHWTNAGAAVANAAVVFNTSRGTIGASATVPGTTSSVTVNTNATGDATAYVTAASTGATILTASAAAGTPAATFNVTFITTTATQIFGLATPATVAANTSLSTANQSVISVTVLDASNNLVKNAHVNFNIVADISGGSLAVPAATTDITGTASVNYIAGTISSQQNGVQIKATVDMVNGAAITNISANINLTVASQALYVRLGTDNTVYTDLPVIGTYTKKYTALVTDAAGNPALDGTQVRFVLRPTPRTKFSFYKGSYSWGGTKWVQTITASCVNEDVNGNGALDPGEDINGNAKLDPFGTASVNGTATTVSGFATASIAYAKGYATWVDMDLEARAGVVGNDPPTVTTVSIPGAAKDYTDANIAPPGQVSPWGSSGSCSDMK